MGSTSWPTRDAPAARIGLTGQYAAVDERLTGEENLEHVARLFHQSRKEAKTRAGELLERFELTGAASRSASTYSGGMRRRLDLAMSLIGRPSVLFLDEPRRTVEAKATPPYRYVEVGLRMRSCQKSLRSRLSHGLRTNALARFTPHNAVVFPQNRELTWT